ncbi:11523_t:CDS:2 [Ambispora leptoticha]|uniref:11523_t:CDS:1 n=1 Tax=Ambispora leptoticha TaxID=144679 RepID=A0A9N8V374_9GLOM|nr:11523_t:CDS:2 [Ambispora leptoticha]
MKHSRRYRKIREQIPSGKTYSISEGIKFLQDHHEEKSKNIEGKIIFPNPLPPQSNLAIIKENLPQPLIEDLQKKTHPESETKIKPLEKILGPKGAYPTKKNGLLTENILEEVNKFSQGEREIKTDKGGNIHTVLGKNDFSLGALEENYKSLYNKITSLKPKGEDEEFELSFKLSKIYFFVNHLLNDPTEDKPKISLFAESRRLEVFFRHPNASNVITIQKTSESPENDDAPKLNNFTNLLNTACSSSASEQDKIVALKEAGKIQGFISPENKTKLNLIIQQLTNNPTQLRQAVIGEIENQLNANNLTIEELSTTDQTT